MKLQFLLTDDHALFRDGMRYVLQQLRATMTFEQTTIGLTSFNVQTQQ